VLGMRVYCMYTPLPALGSPLTLPSLAAI
jgi:hypothetical protein